MRKIVSFGTVKDIFTREDIDDVISDDGRNIFGSSSKTIGILRVLSKNYRMIFGLYSDRLKN